MALIEKALQRDYSAHQFGHRNDYKHFPEKTKDVRYYTAQSSHKNSHTKQQPQYKPPAIAKGFSFHNNNNRLLSEIPKPNGNWRDSDTKNQHIDDYVKVKKMHQRGRWRGRRKQIPTKTSIGVLLCRTNPKTRRTEALLIHKRFTYAFADFVHGHYSRNSDREAVILLDNMTIEELVLIWSLRFDWMWFMVWIDAIKEELYTKKWSKFESTWLRRDGGRRLRNLITRAKKVGTIWWEFPKGKKQTNRESNIDCAIRELEEETGIKKKEYRLIPGVVRRHSYIQGGIRYAQVYYLGMAKENLSNCENFSVSFRKISQIAEVSEIRWMNSSHIQFVDNTGQRLTNIADPLFRLVKKINKGKYRCRDNITNRIRLTSSKKEATRIYVARHKKICNSKNVTSDEKVGIETLDLN